MLFGKDRLQKVVSEAVERIMNRELNGVRSKLGQLGEVADLNKQIETLKIERDRRQEEYDRRERELEHKIGLEKKRQEFETESAKREAVLEVREENLLAAHKRFEEQMEFHRDQLEAQIERAQDMVTEMLKRLPSAEIIADLTVKG